jgi:hypothetical protein
MILGLEVLQQGRVSHCVRIDVEELTDSLGGERSVQAPVIQVSCCTNGGVDGLLVYRVALKDGK